MSQSSAARSKDSNPRSTRQLLDELDDLMNQMLSLPVEDEPAKAKPAPAFTAPAFTAPAAPALAAPATPALAAPAVAATLTMIEPEEPANSPLPFPPIFRGESVSRNDDVPPPKTPRTERKRKRNVADQIPITRATPPVNEPEAVNVSDEMLVEEPRPPFAPFRRESRPVPPSSASWLTRTLVVWDRGFRRATRRLGPLGWLMRTTFGRMLLGLCGLACWIVALAWLVKDWMQWTR